MPRMQEVASELVEGESGLVGPFASWEAICGARETPEAEVEGAQWVRYARCTVTRPAPLSGAGELLAMTTYNRGTPSQGEGALALQTPSGWYVEAVPSDERGPTLSHHSPVSGSYDPASSRVVGGTLQAVMRGGSSSFIPGMGNLGSSSTAWTRVRTCRVASGQVICNRLGQVWSKSCEISAAPSVAQPEGDAPDGLMMRPQGEQTCHETGTDIPRP